MGTATQIAQSFVTEKVDMICAIATPSAQTAYNAAMDKGARDISDGAGYKGCFGHSLGHGVGLKIHETPGLSWGAGNRTLKRMELVTVEPGIYIEGKYGCRIEDMIGVTEQGIVNFAHSTKELIEIY